MIETLLNFFYMGGYGIYVWPAYAMVMFFLVIQWLLPWRRWQKYLSHRLKQDGFPPTRE